MMRSPEDIYTKLGKDVRAPEKGSVAHATAQRLKELLVEHERKADVTFHTLLLTDPQSASFGMSHSENNLVFTANIATAIGRVENLEGVILHEGGHAHHGDMGALRALELMLKALAYIATIRQHLGQRTLTEADELVAAFGRLADFDEACAPLEAGLIYYMPRFERLMKASLFSSRPEHMVNFIERGDSCYRELKAVIHDFPQHSWQEEMDKKLAKTVSKISTSDPLPPRQSHRRHRRQYQEVTASLGHLSDFSTAFRRAHEYAADSFAQGRSDDMDSLAKWLEQRSREEAVRLNRPFTEIISKQGPRHPSTLNRLARLGFLKRHGRAPEADELKHASQHFLENATLQLTR